MKNALRAAAKLAGIKPDFDAPSPELVALAKLIIECKPELVENYDVMAVRAILAASKGRPVLSANYASVLWGNHDNDKWFQAALHAYRESIERFRGGAE
jgi:hypothetical protein